MSAPLLKFPLKPHQVSDEMESFIYVIYFSTLRFHYHEMTQDPNPDLENVKPNDALATWVWDYFFRDVRHVSTQGTFWVGGKTKYADNLAPNQPFKMDDEQTRFSGLLEDLHDACLSHTWLLDEDELRKSYLPPKLVNTALRPARSASQAGSGGQPKKRKRRMITVDADPLTDHSRLLELLDNAIKEEDKWVRDDKTSFDQFYKLPRVTLARDSENSLAVMVSNSEPQTTKRGGQSS